MDPYILSDLCYPALKAGIGRIFRKDHLCEEVTVATDSQDYTFQVHWHLCPGLKPLLCGLGGASSRRPCFLCPWDCSDPELAVAMRSAAESRST
jgi:hypothetical protein